MASRCGFVSGALTSTFARAHLGCCVSAIAAGPLTAHVGKTRLRSITEMSAEKTASFGKTVSSGANVLLVGTNRGVGLEIARECAKRGANVYATTRSHEEELTNIGATAVLEGIDVSDRDVADQVIAKSGLKEGQVFDIVLVIAGIFTNDSIDDLKPEAIMKMYEVCALGPLMLANGLVQKKKVVSGGKIAFITSEGGSISLRTHEEGGANYGHHMSKAGQNMMGKIFSIDMKPKEISVRMIHPGFIRTTMTQCYESAYEEFGAIPPEEAPDNIIRCLDTMTLENTGQFLASQGSASLGFSAKVTGDIPPLAELPF